MNDDQLRIVIEAAERRSRELLNQASNYERLGMTSTASETFDEHYKPLRDAIDAVSQGSAAMAARGSLTLMMQSELNWLKGFMESVAPDQVPRIERLLGYLSDPVAR